MFQGYDHSRSVGNFQWQWLKCWWWCHVWKGHSASSSLRYEDLVSRSWGQPGNLWNLWVPQLVQPILWQIWWLGLLRYYPCWGRVQTKLRAFSLNVSKCWPHQMNRGPISEGIVELFVKTNHLLRGHPHYCASVTTRVDNLIEVLFFQRLNLRVQPKVLDIEDWNFCLEFESSPRVWPKDPDPNLRLI